MRICGSRLVTTSRTRSVSRTRYLRASGSESSLFFRYSWCWLCQDRRIRYQMLPIRMERNWLTDARWFYFCVRNVFSRLLDAWIDRAFRHTAIILPPIYGTISDDIENPYSVYVISSVLDLLLVIVSWLVHNEMCAYYGMNVPRSRALFMILIHLLVVAVFFPPFSF